ncbi:MAG: hypothetical protein HCA25_10175 [Dolichospermum sp. DET50]|nr:hypothetical protein [Dolichospermum sp. DET66]MBS3032631.1 hypothetical protein [Dolichospermum sp. DET67]MBS3037837.1 hypothetical protein [Dolichospermum sp. DET50]QSX69770.1 MAG: hypothetical protein EZY12_09400 [Dolichospermum sp. DET69]
MSNIIFGKSFLALPSLAALLVLGNGLSVNAQTVAPETIVIPTNQASISTVATEEIANRTITPIPGTVETSSAILNYGSTEVSEKTEPSNHIAQSNMEVGRPTRGGSSYIGVAGNVGLSGGTSGLSDGNFTVISKIGITKTLSIRPAAILGTDTTILAPVTYDYSFKSADPFSEPLTIAPYVGIGAAIKTGDKSETALLVTGGVDLPLNNRLTGTAAVNAGFFNETDIGVLVGVGYNFRGF